MCQCIGHRPVQVHAGFERPQRRLAEVACDVHAEKGGSIARRLIPVVRGRACERARGRLRVERADAVGQDIDRYDQAGRCGHCVNSTSTTPFVSSSANSAEVKPKGNVCEKSLVSLAWIASAAADTCMVRPSARTGMHTRGCVP